MTEHDKTLYYAKEPTNASVAARINMTNAGVSRLRRGNRHPSVSVMRAIQKEYGWSMIEQYAAMQHKRYAVEFERVLKEDHAKSTSSTRR